MAKDKWFLGYEVYDELNPPYQPAHVQNDGVYFKFIDDDKWLWVGYIPTPKTRFDWFMYNLIHGIWMKYPLWAVILYSLDKKNIGRFSISAEHRVHMDDAEVCDCGEPFPESGSCRFCGARSRHRQ